MSNPSPERPPLAAQAPERRHTPAAARGPYLSAVRDAWQHARAAHDAEHPALLLALAAYARDGRARGVPVEVLLTGKFAVQPPVIGRAA